MCDVGVCVLNDCLCLRVLMSNFHTQTLQHVFQSSRDHLPEEGKIVILPPEDGHLLNEKRFVVLIVRIKITVFVIPKFPNRLRYGKRMS